MTDADEFLAILGSMRDLRIRLGRFLERITRGLEAATFVLGAARLDIEAELVKLETEGDR